MAVGLGMKRGAAADDPPRDLATPGSHAIAGSPLANAMTVDVEDFFQVQAFATVVERKDWERYPSRIERNLDKVLELFDAYGVKATFFTLGWIAERHPRLIRRIVQEGHELASHGYAHHPVFEQSREAFRADVRTTKKILEDIGQVPVKGYRAASFSIGAETLWALDVLAEEGHAYSSSIYPIRHDHYGMPEAPRFAYRPRQDGFVEIPLTTVSAFGLNLPCSGGGYFRLFPYAMTRWALNRVNRQDGQSCVFYFHPWEIDPGQPRLSRIPLKSRLRHYVNLTRMEARLRRLLGDFSWSRMDRVFIESGS